MATLGIDGLVSGLDTTSLIKQLMQVEAMPQTLLKSKQSTAQTFVSALQGLNTRIASLGEAAATAAKPASWSAWSATSSSESVTATATPSAQIGSVSFSVDAVATSRVALSAATADDGSLLTGMPPSVTVRGGDGTLVTVEPTSGSLQDVAAAINAAADAGVKATVVRVSGGDVPTYRLQFTGTATGAGTVVPEGFEVFAGTADAVNAGTAARLDTATVRAASNASITLWKGSPEEVTFTQASNTFTGLMTGVDVTVSTVTAEGDEPTTVTVGRDTAALTKLAADLVGAFGVVTSEISSRTAITTKVNSNGTTSVTGGVLSGDSAVRAASQQLATAISMPANGFSPSEIGMVIGRDGTVTFDEAKFGAALAADPAKVQSMLTQIADRVATAATSLSDKYDGSLTRKITGQEGLIKDYGNQIEGWDRRLAVRQAGLEKTYANLEVMLSQLNSQSNWLAGQLNALSSSSS